MTASDAIAVGARVTWRHRRATVLQLGATRALIATPRRGPGGLRIETRVVPRAQLTPRRRSRL